MRPRLFALAHAPAYQHPRFVWFIDALPLSSTNKIDRAALKQALGLFVVLLNSDAPDAALRPPAAILAPLMDQFRVDSESETAEQVREWMAAVFQPDAESPTESGDE